jgi:hypothetical protein
MALERLILRLGEQHDAEPVELWAPHRLVVRESTVGAPARAGGASHRTHTRVTSRAPRPTTPVAATR